MIRRGRVFVLIGFGLGFRLGLCFGLSLGLCSGWGLGVNFSFGLSVDLSLGLLVCYVRSYFLSSAALSLSGQRGVCEFIACDFPN